jgi:hypothetical protein
MEPEREAKPAEFMRTRGFARVLHRFDRARILLDCHSVDGTFSAKLFVMDLEGGSTRAVLPDRQTVFVAAEGASVYFLEVLRPDSIGYKLKENEDKKDATVAESDLGRYKLRVFDLAAGTPSRSLLDATVRSVAAVRKEGLWAIVHGEPPSLWLIPRDAKDPRKVLDLDPSWVPSLTTGSFSPGGTHLALGVCRPDAFFRERDLVVVDVAKGIVTFERRGIPTQQPGSSSAIPSLHVSWVDEDRIRFTESVVKGGALGVHTTRVELNLRTKERSEVPPEPPAPTRWDEGLFTREWDKLYFKGDSEPIVARGKDPPGRQMGIAVSPDGRWATYFDDEDGPSHWLVDGKERSKRIIVRSWHHTLQWLPATR